MSMSKLISKKVYMKKSLLFLTFIFVYSGCSITNIDKKVGCDNRDIPPKSLLFLEQQYNCNRQ